MSEVLDHLNAVIQVFPDWPLARFFIKHGRLYHMDDLSFADEREEPQQCYQNATLLACRRPDLTYVEGKVSMDGLPIDHAWCVDEMGTVVDTTLALPLDGSGHMERVREYFGIPFRTDYLKRAVLLNDVYGLLDGFYAKLTLPKLVELGLENGQQWLLDQKVRTRKGKLVMRP